MKSDRRLPVAWAVFKGALKNKAILVPYSRILSAFLPAAVKWLLMAEGIYLGYEGYEAIKGKFPRKESSTQEPKKKVVPRIPEALAEYEKRKVKGALKTDFILFDLHPNMHNTALIPTV